LGADHPAGTVIYSIKLLRPTPTNGPNFTFRDLVDLTGDRATIEGALSAGGKFARHVAEFLSRSKSIPRITECDSE